jgi:predicted glycosyltransferase
VKVVVDIGHPAHVHMFKYFIQEMKRKEHEILVTATRKDVAIDLLANYGLSYIALGSYGKSVVEKLINIPLMDIKMYRAVRRFKPDIFIGVGSIRAAHVSRLIRKPCISFEDSEPTPYEHALYVPFTDTVLTPSCFRKDFGGKQIKYKGYKELAYLHPNYFKPSPEVLNELGLTKNDKFVILRFVAWTAVHDVGRRGFDRPTKMRLVTELERYARVFITSEGPLPKELEKYRILLPPEKIHDLLYYATLLVGDTQTMTTEAAVLGTPAIRCNSFVGPDDMGNFIELEKEYDLLYSFREPERAIDKALELLQQPDLKARWNEKRDRLLADKIDVTRFMVDFVENYPGSILEYENSGRN